MRMSCCRRWPWPLDTRAIDNTQAIYGKADHEPACPYWLLSVPICQGADITSRFSHYLRHIPTSIWIHHTSSCPLCTRVDIHSSPVSQYRHHVLSLSKRCPLSTLLFVHAGRQDQANRRSHNASRQTCSNPTQATHRCDYDLVRCRSTVVIALFAFVIVSHYTHLEETPFHPLVVYRSIDISG